MSSTTKLNGVRLGRMIIAGANELASNKQLVDAMNVFPVPDGDTGTNNTGNHLICQFPSFH